MKQNFTRKFPAAIKAGLVVTLVLVLLNVHANTYTVTNTNNSGAGSLRQAITDANANPGADIIQFNIATGGGNTFESSGGNSWAVISLTSVLPIITGPVLIDGFTQSNTNTGFIGGKTVGAATYTQANINYPDVYITRTSSFSLPNNADNTDGYGLAINSVDVTIRGICISGFGNTSSDGGTASGHAEIGIIRSSSARSANTNINNCFISCDPRGVIPSSSVRKSRGNGILVCANNYNGTITNNYIAHSGTYAIHFNGGTDNASGSVSNAPNRNWTISENQIINGGMNASSSGGNITANFVGDGVNTMNCKRFLIRYNYIENMEQVGIDIGYNADSNYVENNTITGFVKTYAALPMAGIRIGLNSQGDSLVQNVIYNNTSSDFLGGIWIDRSSINTSGITIKDNINHYVGENIIHDNNSSGIVAARNPTSGSTVNSRYNIYSRNSIYNNDGLGIDLNFSGTSGSPAVTVNDNGDVDGGVNDLQNFPIIDSVKLSSISSYVTIWGKAPPGSTIEFFGGDGGWNKHNSPSPKNLNYGEGKNYIGTGLEGSVDDGVSGTGSYSIDGNSAVNNVNLFRFSFLYLPAFGSIDSLTATATLNKNTSEFGPMSFVEVVLGCTLFDLSALHADGKTKLFWSAICDEGFNYFAIERSKDGANFTRLGQVNKKVGIYNETDFDYTDFSPLDGNNYYRLKMINADGSFKYSKIIRVNTQGESKMSLKVAPNPFVSELNLVLNAEKDENINVRIIDNSGRIVRTQQLKGRRGTNIFDINDLDRLPKGYYIVEVFYNNQVMRERIIKN